MDIKTLATQLSEALERKKRTSGVEFITLREGSPKWMTDVVRSVHDHGKNPPNDTTYQFIARCAEAIAEITTTTLDDEEAAQEAIYSIEPDVYTYDLTAWLHASVLHVEYLTEVMEECSPTDGFNLLTMAQGRHIVEVGEALIAALAEQVEAFGEPPPPQAA
jgi:hypothetical protein